jgi:hypothetical protein
LFVYAVSPVRHRYDHDAQIRRCNLSEFFRQGKRHRSTRIAISSHDNAGVHDLEQRRRRFGLQYKKSLEFIGFLSTLSSVELVPVNFSTACLFRFARRIGHHRDGFGHICASMTRHHAMRNADDTTPRTAAPTSDSGEFVSRMACFGNGASENRHKAEAPAFAGASSRHRTR